MQKVEVSVIDDVEKAKGKEVPADQTVLLGWEGKSYQLDLSETNYRKLSELVGPWVKVGSRVGSNGNGNGGLGRTSAHRRRSAEVRAWAREKGLPVSERGRIPRDVEKRFLAAHR